MQSLWFKSKSEAILLRKRGKSLKYIHKTLGVPLSTLSGWCRPIKLSKKQLAVLRNNHNKGLIEARKKAVVWHNQQKDIRLEISKTEASKILSKINFKNKEVIELALAMLYLGEGFKKSAGTGIGNSDPLILKFFLKILINFYNIDINKVRFELHLRYDQNPKIMKEFWSKELDAPIERFIQVSLDKRTIGKPTYDTYKGVCIVNCGNIAIQRKLVYLSRYFCERVIENLRA